MKLFGTEYWRAFTPQIQYSPESIQWAVAQMVFCTNLAECRRQPQRPVSQLEWQALVFELQLARQ